MVVPPQPLLAQTGPEAEFHPVNPSTSVTVWPQVQVNLSGATNLVTDFLGKSPPKQ